MARVRLVSCWAATETTSDQLFAWAVRDGDFSVVPPPAAVGALGAALALLVEGAGGEADRRSGSLAEDRRR